MVEKVQSAGWIVYMIEKNIPKFLLIKRFALSKRVERIAPKWKIMKHETSQKAALRETHEEAWLMLDKLIIKEKLDTISLQLYNSQWKLGIDKDITYFLVNYVGHRDDVKIIDGEGFLWMYKWANIQEVLWLVPYTNLRELYRTAYHMIPKLSKRDEFIKNF